MRVFARACSRLLGLTLLWGLLVLATPACAETLPSPPEFQSLHYTIVSRSGEQTRETVVDAQPERWRIETKGTQGPLVAISWFDAATGTVTDYRIQGTANGVRRTTRQLGGNPKDGERVFRECYPGVWQGLLDASQSGLTVAHQGQDTINGETMEVYAWQHPLNGIGRRWLMRKREDGWVPVRCVALQVGREPQTFDFSDVRFNAPLQEALFALPEGSAVIPEGSIVTPEGFTVTDEKP